MKILLFLAVWKRPELTELCFQGIARLRAYDPQRFQVEALAVISEPSMRALCKQYNIHYIEHENLPLGKKKNAGLHAAFQHQWDYLIELGSDDLISNQLLEVYEPLMKKAVPHISLNQLVFVDSETGQGIYFKSDGCFGLGRAFSREMLQQVCGRVEVEAIEPLFTNGVVIPKGQRDYIYPHTAIELAAAGFCKITGSFTYHLWPDHINRGMDNSSNYLLQAHGIQPYIVTAAEPLAIDIKGKENIWPFDASIGVPYPITAFLSRVSEQERKTFFSICNQKAKAA